MCQSKAEGGRRCAAHNNQREHNRSKRELKAAVSHRDSLISAHDSGNTRVTGDDIAAAEHDVLVRADLAMLMDPKLTDEQLEALWDNASPEVQAAARPVAASVIAHGKAAAKLSGEASTARMFDRDDEAERFELEAEEERSKAARMVDALRAALTDAKTHVSEGVHDTVSGGIIGVMREFASEVGQSLGDGVSETAAAIGEGLDETVEALAAGVGISAPAETGHGEPSPEGGDDGSSGDDGSTAAENDDSGDDSEDSTAADDSDDDDSSDDDESAPSTGDSPRQAPAQPPANAVAADTPADAVDGDSASAGHGPTQVKGRTDSESPSAGKRQDKSRVRTPSTSAGGTPSPAPGIGHGHGVTPKPQPVRQVRAGPSGRVMGTPQKSSEPFDVTRLSDSELLSFISRLYEKLRR